VLKRIQPQATIVVGGYHCLASTEDFAHCKVIDFVVRGDGIQFLDALLARAALPRVSYFPVTAPDPRPMLYEDYPYRFRGLPSVAHIQLSKGCPFTCSFCCEPFIGNSRFVPLPVDEAIAEIDKVIAIQNPAKIIIEDLIFGFHAGWRHSFLEALRDRHYKQIFWVEMRVDTITERTAELLSQMNFDLTIGLESASRHTLRTMDKTKNPERYIDAFYSTAGLVQKHQVPTTFTIMLNYPGETLESYTETMDHIRRVQDAVACPHFRFDFVEYSFYPGNQTYAEIDKLKERFGTEICDRHWYRRRDGSMLERSLCAVPSKRLADQVGRGAIRSYFERDVRSVDERQRVSSQLRGRLFWSYRFIRSLQREFAALGDWDFFARDLCLEAQKQAASIVTLADTHRSLTATVVQAMEESECPSWLGRTRAWRAVFNLVVQALGSPEVLDDLTRVDLLKRDLEHYLEDSVCLRDLAMRSSSGHNASAAWTAYL
jgi:radical SAM superfamily enzyme YgiQ (UPF0313 family)